MTTDSKSGTTRRGFLKAGLAAGGALAGGTTAARAAGPDPTITEIQPWNQENGDPVDAAPSTSRRFRISMASSPRTASASSATIRAPPMWIPRSTG